MIREIKVDRISDKCQVLKYENKKGPRLSLSSQYLFHFKIDINYHAIVNGTEQRNDLV